MSFKFKLAGMQYTAIFEHKERAAIYKKEHFRQRITICTIHHEKQAGTRFTYSYIADGLAAVHYNDQFCKSTGRLISLKHALKHWDLPRELRFEVWAAYFSSLHREPLALMLFIKPGKKKNEQLVTVPALGIIDQVVHGNAGWASTMVDLNNQWTGRIAIMEPIKGVKT